MADTSGTEELPEPSGLDRSGASGMHFEILGPDEGVTRATIDADFARWFKGSSEVRAGRPEFTKGELQVLELDPERTALIIVDMQNDFVREGAPLEVPDARATIDNHRKLLKRFRERQGLIVFTRFIAGPGRTLIWNWSTVLAPPTCCCWPGFMRSYNDVEGTRDAAAVIDELAPLPNELQVEKYNYGAFHRTSLLDSLQARGVEAVVVTGTVTQICVDETARGAFREGLKAVMISDAVSSFDQDLHHATLTNFAMKFGWVMSTDEVLV